MTRNHILSESAKTGCCIVIMEESKRMMKQKVTVVGIGYVGLGVGVMLSTRHDVTMLDVDQRKVDLINEGKSPIKEGMVDDYLSRKMDGSIKATTDKDAAYKDADFIIVSVPTDYDEVARKFDTGIVEGVVNEAIERNRDAIIVIKSTIPVGYTKGLIERLNEKGYADPKVMFSPEFLREGTALKDNLYPSRVIVGCGKGQESLAGKYMGLIRSVAIGEYRELIMGSTEAEAVKLFANTYLAMRVAYFNELDTYAECNGLNAKEIIEGMCQDPRISNQYNNPSFGYGGYCFPKDTKQLLANFNINGVPQDLISAIVKSNDTRKIHVVNTVIEKLEEIYDKRSREGKSRNGVCIGIYKLAMKSGSDNSRESAILNIIQWLRRKAKYSTNPAHKFLMLVYDPSVPEILDGVMISENNLEKFKEECDIILANRYDEELDDVKDKVYTRDIFNNN